MKKPMGKSLPLTLLGVINRCHLHDVREMTRPDDTTDTLSTYGGLLCYTVLSRTDNLPAAVRSMRGAAQKGHSAGRTSGSAGSRIDFQIENCCSSCELSSSRTIGTSRIGRNLLGNSHVNINSLSDKKCLVMYNVTKKTLINIWTHTMQTFYLHASKNFETQEGGTALTEEATAVMLRRRSFPFRFIDLKPKF
jgi:hypothetical protein